MIRDVVQPQVFVTAALKREQKKLALTWSHGGQSLQQVYTQNLCFVNYTKCRSTLLIQIWILAFCLCTSLFFLALQRGREPYFDTGGFQAQLLVNNAYNIFRIMVQTKNPNLDLYQKFV